MDASSVIQTLAPLESKLREIGVARLLLVGSAAKGTFGSDSDLDLIVEFIGEATFLGFMELQELLESTLGVPIDLTTKKALRPEIAEDILAGARQVA